MRLRLARKLLKQHNQMLGHPLSRFITRRRVWARYRRWKHRPMVLERAPRSVAFHLCDDHGRISPPSPNKLDNFAFFSLLGPRRVHEFDGKRVSTVFLGINHNYFSDDPAEGTWFETAMQLPGRRVEVLRRHTDWASAKMFHDTVVAALRANGTWTRPETTLEQ